MPRLLFKREFLEAIRQGRKTTTLRRWKSPRVKRGDRINVPGAGVLHITACSRIDLKDLKAADARADGFAGLSQLRAALRKFYPNMQNDGRHWYRIAFRVELSPSDRAHFARADRSRVAGQIGAELDKAVRRSELLFPL